MGTCYLHIFTNFTIVTGCPVKKTIFKENDILHQDSKVGNKNDFCDNYRPKKYRSRKSVHFSVRKPKFTKHHTLPNLFGSRTKTKEKNLMCFEQSGKNQQISIYLGGERSKVIQSGHQ